MKILWLPDRNPEIEPQVTDADRHRVDWPVLTLTYQADKHPIRLEQITDSNELREVVEEVLEELRNRGVWERQQDLVGRLRDTHRAFHFELGTGLPDDVWEMLDSTESYLARELDGVIKAHEGFFDAELKPSLIWDGKI